MEEEQVTRYSLLERALEQGDDSAWEDLFKHYRNFLYYVLNDLQFDQNDIDDVAQQVMILLTRDLKDFDREKAKFRSWFGRVIRNTALMHMRKKSTRKESPNLTPTEDMNLLDSMQESEIDHVIEEEWKAYVSELAMERVSKTYEGKAVAAFELGLEGVSVKETAQRLDINEHSVYTLRNRVKQSLLFEIRTITKELEG